MSGLDEVEVVVSTLRPQKGDVVVLRLSNAMHLQSEDVERVAEQLRASLPDDVHGVVVFGHVGDIEGFSTLLDRAEKAVVDAHESEMRRYLGGEVPVNQWRPRIYAEAAIRAAFDIPGSVTE